MLVKSGIEESDKKTLIGLGLNRVGKTESGDTPSFGHD